MKKGNNIVQQSFDFKIEERPKDNTLNKKRYYTKLEKELIKIIKGYQRRNKLYLSLNFVLVFLCCILSFICYYNEKASENILFLGDSITARYDLQSYYKNNIVINSGVNGNTTDDILNDIDNRVYQFNPTKVFLLIGANDIEQGKNSDEICANIKKIISNIQKNMPNTEIYLESIYPINDGNDEIVKKNTVGKRTNEEIEKINNELSQYCDESNVTFINVYPMLLDDDKKLDLDYTVDGLHISKLGYKEITKVIKKYM